MASEANQMNLQKYARHVPRALGQQMLVQLIKQFMAKEDASKIPENGSGAENTAVPSSTGCAPSVARFYGALLFVDISGFTVLSQRLPVDELRVHINSYFRKILDLIYNHGGDVIKFAGDALYALWKRTPKQDVYTALVRAAKCGMEINATCSHYRINFTVRDRDTSQLSDLLLNADESKSSHQQSREQKSQEEDHAFLDVHAGLAVGPMAGIDVGALDRWEYLIIGPPLKHVAMAESEAQKGELVVSPIVHDILCARSEAPSETSAVFCSGEPEEAALFVRTEQGCEGPCGCFRTAGGSFRLNPKSVADTHADVLPEQREEEKDDADYEFELQAMILEDAAEAFATAKVGLMEVYKAQREKVKVNTSNPAQAVSPRSGKFGDVNDDEGEIVFSYFLRWVESCMSDDLFRHAHEAVRGDYKMLNTNRRDCMYYCTKDVELATKSRRSSTASEDRSRRSSNSSSDSGGYVNKIKSATSVSLREKHRERHEKTLKRDSAMVGELRNVMVMFISIKSAADELLFEEKSQELTPEWGECALKAFSFIYTTAAERSADLKILAHYQTCMEIIVSALKKKGGQLRQFIVDDKGTVCIGTFGLRGSVNHDNAAAAIEAAHEIIGDLREHNIEVGIGVTSGKAYCGLVGSLRRHEYAVMGPSINLSARLMASAKAGHVICDVNIRKGDRLHQYRAMGEVKAKGYAKPVPIFRPVLIRGSVMSTDGGLLPLHRERSTSQGSADSPRQTGFSRSDTAGGEEALQRLARENLFVGREDIKTLVFNFLVTPLLVEADAEPTDEKKSDICVITKALSQVMQLSTDFPTRLAILEGSSGIGKSALLNYFSGVLAKPIKVQHLNAVVIRAASSSFHSIDPFKSIKPAIRKVLSYYAAISNHEKFEGDEDPTQAPQPKDQEAKDSVSKWKAGLEFISHRLSEDTKLLLPLLTSAHIVSGIPSNAVTEALNGADKLLKLQNLLFEIVSFLPAVSSKVVFFICDDAQFLDPASWQLLQQIWEKGAGFALMLAFSGKVDNHESHPLTKSLAKKSHEDMFVSCDRLCRKELPPLSSDAVKCLVEHIFQEAGFHIDDETLYSRIQDISGGNPLYIYELSKAMIDKYLATRGVDEVKDSVADTAVVRAHHSVLTRSDVGKLLKGFQNARVEEVIYYRFDQLPALSQTLLKLASVACASGASGFTLPLLLMMLSKEDSEDAPTNVFTADMQLDNNRTLQQALAAELKKILMKDEFLRVDASSRRSSVSDSHKDDLAADIASALQKLVNSDVDDDMLFNDLEQHTFHFKIVLERQTIYDLMLEEQRESLHDRVAAYMEKENQEKEDFFLLSAHDLYEEGFHWEKATIWSSAMSCYFRSAMMLNGLGAYQESFQRLTSSYRMLNALRKDAGLPEDLQRPYDMDGLIAFIQKSVEADVVNRESVQAAFGMSAKDVYKIFGGDAASLQTGVNVCLRLAQASFTLSDNYNIISKLYEDALIMIMLSWRDVGSNEPLGEHELVLPDQQVVFPILAGISTMFRTNRLQDDEVHSKEAALYEMIMLFAQDSPDFALHNLQGMCLLHSLYSERLELDKCGELANQIKQVYNLEEHSSQLVKWYGNDRVAYTLAKNIMLQKLRGCVIASNQDIRELLEMSPKITHLHSMGILALPLSSVLVAVRREIEGEKVFSLYYDMEQSREGFSFFRESNPIFAEFFRVYGCFLNGMFCPHDDLTPIQRRIMNKDFLPAKRSLLFDAVSSMAVSVESLCGMILEMLAGMWLKHASIVESPSGKVSLFTHAMMALEVAADYADVAVRVSAGGNRLVFSHTLALVNKAGIAHTTALVKSKVLPDEQVALAEANKYHTIAKDSLNACAQLGLKLKFPFVVLLAAQDMQECGYDLEQSTEWQEESIKRIVAGNDQSKKQEVYEEIVRIFPTTERLKHAFGLDEQ